MIAWIVIAHRPPYSGPLCVPLFVKWQGARLSDSVVVSRGGQTDFFVGFKDLMAGLARRELWLAFAADEVQNRYRRSRLGLIWIILSYSLFVAAITVFFGGFSQKGPAEFAAHMAVTYAMYSFLSSQITDGCSVFQSAKTWVSSMPLPRSVHVLKSVARGIFVFAISMIVAMVILIATGHVPGETALLAVAAFLVILVNGVFAQTYLGYLAARYRDLDHLMSSITRLLFFVTPILWVRSEQPVGSLRRTLADINPLTHALEIFTAPMMGRMPDINSWYVIFGLTLFNFAMMLIVSWFGYRRLAYWI